MGYYFFFEGVGQPPPRLNPSCLRSRPQTMEANPETYEKVFGIVRAIAELTERKRLLEEKSASSSNLLDLTLRDILDQHPDENDPVRKSILDAIERKEQAKRSTVGSTAMERTRARIAQVTSGGAGAIKGFISDFCDSMNSRDNGTKIPSLRSQPVRKFMLACAHQLVVQWDDPKDFSPFFRLSDWFTKGVAFIKSGENLFAYKRVMAHGVLIAEAEYMCVKALMVLLSILALAQHEWEYLVSHVLSREFVMSCEFVARNPRCVNQMYYGPEHVHAAHVHGETVNETSSDFGVLRTRVIDSVKRVTAESELHRMVCTLPFMPLTGASDPKIGPEQREFLMSGEYKSIGHVRAKFM